MFPSQYADRLTLGHFVIYGHIAEFSDQLPLSRGWRLIICHITYKCNDCEFAALLHRTIENV